MSRVDLVSFAPCIGRASIANTWIAIRVVAICRNQLDFRDSKSDTFVVASVSWPAKRQSGRPEKIKIIKIIKIGVAELKMEI